ncbi:MAG: outer membrane protein transport protein [Acidocella sp.]|nr:outer membrane protein transport protein [Acidocella sp.]
MIKNIKASYGLSLVAIAAVLSPGVASATDGYFAAGYGMQNIAMGGTAFAVTNDGLYGANNPANGSFSDNEFDLGLNLFIPGRTASRTGNAYGLNGSATSRTTLFPIPEFGYNNHLTDRLTIGLSIYGNGGMNTAYPGGQLTCGPGAPPGNLLCGQGGLGVSLTQVLIAPTVSYRLNDSISVGIAPQFAIQQFSASGLQAFTGVSQSPGNVTDRGDSYSYGAGVRFGGYWRVNQLLALGITYQTQVYSTKFSQYSGLFAGGGSFNIPANFGAGVALHITPTLLVAADYERIFYSGVAAIGNQSSNHAPLGSANGPGFGWRDINVFKIGVADQVLPNLTLRAGYNHSDDPVTSSNITFNLLAPGVIENQIAFGATYDLSPVSSLTASYTHAFKNTVSGATSPLLPGGGIDSASLTEDEIGISYERKF